MKKDSPKRCHLYGGLCKEDCWARTGDGCSEGEDAKKDCPISGNLCQRDEFFCAWHTGNECAVHYIANLLERILERVEQGATVSEEEKQ